jgi:outer membrane autotransporter protein
MMIKKNKSLLLSSIVFFTIHTSSALADIIEGDGTIDIVASVSTVSNTPESALGQAMSRFCPRILALEDGGQTLSPDTKRLLEVCTTINSNPALTEEAYRQLSAYSVTAITTVLSRMPLIVSLEDIGSRLAALRRAARQMKLASWQPDLDSASLLADASLLNATGGGASADEPGGLFDNRLSGFFSGAYVASEQTGTDTLAGFNNDIYAMTLGLDYRFKHDAYAGVATRLLNGNADLDDNGGSLDSNDVNLTLYGSYFPSQSFYVDATLQASSGKYDLTRRIDFTVNTLDVFETAEGSTNGNQLGFSLGWGFEHTFSGPAITAQLNAGYRYSKAKLDAYTEEGALGLNLDVDEQTIESRLMSVGTQFSRAFSLGWGVMLPQLNVSWKHDFRPAGQDISASFAADPFGTKFVFTTEDRDADFFEVALGVSTVSPGGWSTFAQLTTIAGYTNYDQNMLSLGVRKEF